MNVNKVSRLTIVDRKYKVRQFVKANSKLNNQTSQKVTQLKIVPRQQDQAA